MISGFVSALRTLTRIPIKGKDAENFSSSLYWFPMVATLLAAMLSGVILIFDEIINPKWNEAIAITIMFLGTVLTGALHLDGLADWADSLGAKPNKEKMLAIMKDSTNGAFGVVALVFILLAKWIALVQLLNYKLAFVGIFVAYISSRFAMVYLSVTLPYARAEGGTGKPIIEGASAKHLIVALLTSILILFFVGNISAILIFILTLIVTQLWREWCKKYFTGITGDLLGAGSEFVEVAALFFVALFYNSINEQIVLIFNKL